MKKNMKKAEIARTIATIIQFTMDEYWFHEYVPDGDNDDADADYTTSNPYMVTFYDKDHHRLVGNWIWSSNILNSWTDSIIIETIINETGINLPHFFWGEIDDLLTKVRYVRIGKRRYSHTADDEEMITENGNEFSIFEREKGGCIKQEKYKNSWYFDYHYDKRYYHEKFSTPEERVQYINNSGDDAMLDFLTKEERRNRRV